MIYIGSDHAGYELKEKLKVYIKELGYALDDKGAVSLNNEDDYPDYVKLVSNAVSLSNENFGIIIGGSGEGEAMCANKIKGIRAAVYYGGIGIQKDMNGNKLGVVASSRRHNNANVLSLGARFITLRKAKKAVKIFLETPFSNEERHVRRINKLEPSS